ncbi:hypothetical protein Cme02nite_55480 [Catellatospora methionotrophica]|uniref:Uncharacterized protein n=1 Tax=Catellatospora methionotrophica TaxID=121620 RepID=A0A8J3PJA4_9ACTN|nr:hypothetical protein [Catellatospora methionotrophica]GIG17216.1 hypothetical protein Cme02nite_55480 [Catellatospora methionotrophica]
MLPDNHYGDSTDDGTELAERIERLCRAFDRGDLYEVLAAADAEEQFETALTEIRAGASDPARIRGALDALDDQLLLVGVHGFTRANRSFRLLPPGPGSEQVWVCPLRMCVRAESQPSAKSRCAVGGRGLEPVTVPG